MNQVFGSYWDSNGDNTHSQKKCSGYFLSTYTVFRARRITFSLANRVENQNEPKRPQGGDRLGSFWFSTRPTAM